MERKKGNYWGCLVSSFIVFVVALMAFAWGGDYTWHPPTPVDRGPDSGLVDRSDACSMSQKFVRDALKSPASAKFPLWTEENCIVSQRGRIWIVSSYVDAQNSFGAMLRNDYVVEMIYYPSTDKWTLQDIQIMGR